MLSTLAARAARRMPRGLFGTCVGRFARSRVSRIAVRPFIWAFGVDTAEADRDVSDYGSLSEFFVRKLKDGARPVDADPGGLISPVDGVLSDCGRVHEGTAVMVKGRTLGIVDLVGYTQADHLLGGGFSVHYLHPRDYHWIHSPCEGNVTAYSHIPGDFYPVFPAAQDEFGCTFAQNERVITFMETPLGRMAVAKVAAMGVGNISLAYAGVEACRGSIENTVELDPPVPVAKGDPLGTFHFGSTVVVVWENAGIVPLPGVAGRHVLMGESFARIGNPPR
ncbi:MAG: phosphatidylserine decarboxylase [Deltaproteobacteria bacterium]|nr:phosphatidylserine decarboxylase [Deltaproteobacteria bacterium]